MHRRDEVVAGGAIRHTARPTTPRALMNGSGGRLHRPPPSRPRRWLGNSPHQVQRRRPRRARRRARPARLAGLGGRARWAPFGAGAAVALAAVILYGILAPGTPPLTAQDVKDSIAERARVRHAAAGLLPVGLPGGPALARADPDQGRRPEATPGTTRAAVSGSGVVVNQGGDILTSRHVIHGATSIELTFADGSDVPGRDRQRAARARHRRHPRDDPARDAGPGDHRRPARGPAGERGLRDGQPVRALRLDQRGRHLGARPLVPDAATAARC